MKKSPEWADITLRFAGVVNVVWGLIFALFTSPLFRWAQLPEPPFLFPWQLIGISTIVFGLAYYIASFNIPKHALVVVMGFAIKLASTVAVWKSVVTRDFPLPLALYFSAKDLLWLVPFALVLYYIFQRWQHPEKDRANPTVPLAETLARFRTDRGRALYALSQEQPVLLIFLPPVTSPLFQNFLADISQQRAAIKQKGALPVLVHAERSERMVGQLRRAGLAEEAYVNDPDHTIHNTFNLKRAALRHLFSVSSWKQGWLDGGLANTNLDELTSDGFRMPATFLIYRGELLKSYHYEQLSDSPDYGLLADRAT